MQIRFRLAALLILCVICAAPLDAQVRPYQQYLPLIAYRPPAASRLGIVVLEESPDSALPLLAETGAAWGRAGDVDWSRVEPEPGQRRWELLASLETNVQRVRAAGLEPMANLQRSPLWAAQIAGRVCSPPRADALDDLELFAEQVARRYSSGPLAIHVWQVGNEVDFRPDQLPDYLGSGCWGTGVPPFYGGDYYGEVLKRTAAAIRRGNPGAIILAAGMAHIWPDDTEALGFLRGMLAAGAGPSFDALSYSGYGNWGINELMVLKAAHLRGVLAEYGMGGKRLVAAEIASVCLDSVHCPPDYPRFQADYAARIYAEAIAADLEFASWYPFLDPRGDPLQHGLLNPDGTPRPAYYALRNSVALMKDARPAGPPIGPFPEDQGGALRVTLAVPDGLLYVIWEPRGQGGTAFLPMPPGARATCTDRLELPVPQTYDCTGQARDGLLSIAATSPRYVRISAP